MKPKTEKEWQEAVDAAVGLRAIEDCKMYGLLEGGPNVDVRRCDSILDEGRSRGVLPSAPSHELAVALIAQLNAQITPK